MTQLKTKQNKKSKKTIPAVLGVIFDTLTVTVVLTSSDTLNRIDILSGRLCLSFRSHWYHCLEYVVYISVSDVN